MSKPTDTIVRDERGQDQPATKERAQQDTSTEKLPADKVAGRDSKTADEDPKS
jgi:hypothetical protein